jgi:PhnB protein
MPITRLNPYIHFNGNAADAIQHYVDVLGAKVGRSMTYGEMPGNTPAHENKSRIMHCELTLGACSLMVSDAPAEHQGTVGSNVEVSVAYDDEVAMTQAFDGLAKEGQIVFPLHDAFWGGKFGMLVDRYNIHWMFTLEPAK